MTDTLIDRADSGEIPKLTGEHRMRIDLGEATQNLNPYLVPSGPFPIPLRHNDTTPESLVTGHGYDPEAHLGPIVDMIDTVTFHITAGVDGELRPAAPGPKPGPLPPPPPRPTTPRPGYAGRHRLTFGRRVRRLLAGLGVVGAALVAIWLGLFVAGLAVFL